MNKFKTVALFTYPTDLSVAKSFLESHQIECFTLDELTVQVHNFYSNAIGGIRLQVKSEDFVKAKTLLIDNGFIEKEEIVENDILIKLDSATSKIPFINGLKLPLRLTLLLLTVTILLGFLVYLLVKPTTEERLTNSRWCINQVAYKGALYTPHSKHTSFIIYGECDESVTFKQTGGIELPGFNNDISKGRWKLSDDEVEIFGINNYPDIFEGTYTLKIKRRILILTSKTTTLYCYR